MVSSFSVDIAVHVLLFNKIQIKYSFNQNEISSPPWLDSINQQRINQPYNMQGMTQISYYRTVFFRPHNYKQYVMN